MPTPLEIVHQQLVELSAAQNNIHYAVPALWIPPHKHAGTRILRNPAAYYAGVIGSILKKRSEQHKQKLDKQDVVYLTHIRHTTAWDHDGSGVIKYTVGTDGWRQTGTFIKLIALLPYLQWLGVTTLLLLPPTAHGCYRKKGTLGSPYAPRDHCSIEPTLAEPILESDAETQFAALVEACHRLGLRVIVELALRVASLDCPLICQHPEWFYWVREDVRQPLEPPSFSAEDIAKIHDSVARQDFASLPQPSAEYRSQFVEPPVHVEVSSTGLFIGETADGIRCVVPSAFADYPPDDTQPLWSDITYFRLHTHPQYNYIAYDTIRYFRRELDGWENKPLWDYLASIIPHWQARFGIDGVLLDMGHAFPNLLHRTIVQRARASNPAFVMIEESFDRADPTAIAFGYDLVVGDVWHWTRSIEQLRHFALKASQISTTKYFAAPDTHNTPRIMSRGRATAYYALAVCSLLPGGVPLITSGTELGETEPINTGLDFSAKDIAQYPPERLPLFSGRTLRWDHPDWEMLSFLRAIYAPSTH